MVILSLVLVPKRVKDLWVLRSTLATGKEIHIGTGSSVYEG